MTVHSMAKATTEVLLVEDNPGDARLLAQMLLESDRDRFSLSHASYLREALALVQEQDFDVVVLDLALPDSHGMATVEELKRWDPESSTPIVVVTGLDDEWEGIEALKRGAQDYLVKETLQPGMLARSLRYAVERQRSERDLRIAKQTAEQANAMKSQFLANMSHELRTPLNSILGFSELMLSEVAGQLQPDRYGGYVKDIHSCAQHLHALIDDLLDLSKAEAGKLLLDETDFDAIELVRGVIGSLMPQARASGIKLHATPSSPSLWLRADRRKLKQVVLNLLSNALKFTDRGGEVRVETSTNADGDLTIAVVDNGIGIPRDQFPRAFAAFVQVENAYRRSGAEGTGLGLALSKRLVEALGGVIRLESEVGLGTTARVTLPHWRVFGSGRRGEREPANYTG